MKTLETIQKTCKVFHTLAKIASILCIIGAATLGAGALCAVIQHYGGQVFSIFGEPIRLFDDGADLPQTYVKLLSGALMLTADAVLFALSRGYLTTELADGTPFTESGAEKLKKLGIRFIYIPVIAVALSELTAALQGVSGTDVIDNAGRLVTGIVLIFTSLIFRYGAESESGKAAEENEQNGNF
mgnify:CR=1 FL=1